MIVPNAALREIKKQLPPSIVSPEAFRAAQAVAERLPNAASAFGLELRLAPGSGDVDLAVALDQSDGGLIKVSEYLQSYRLEIEAEDLIRQKLENFFTDWATPGGVLDRMISHAWLEYDVDRSDSNPLQPGIFVAFHKDALSRGESQVKNGIERALTSLLGCADQARIRASQVIDLQKKFPAGVEVVHLGVLLSRAENHVRVVFRAETSELIMNSLRAIAWPGSISAVQDWFDGASGSVFPTMVHIEVGDQLSLRTDIEYRTAGLSKASGHNLLSDLASRGLCCPQKQNDLDSWIGWNFSEWSEISPSVVWKTLHHLKLTFKPNQDPIAKAYLWVSAGQNPLDWIADQMTEMDNA